MTKIAHESVEAQENPETGERVYPWTTPDSYGVDSDGSVTGCDCDRCEDRRAA